MQPEKSQTILGWCFSWSMVGGFCSCYELWQVEWWNGLSLPWVPPSRSFSLASPLLVSRNTHLICARPEVIQILTGHSFINSSLAKRGMRVDVACSCGYKTETARHFLFSCPLFCRQDFVSCCTENIGVWPQPFRLLVSSPPLWPYGALSAILYKKPSAYELAKSQYPTFLYPT